MSTFVEDLKAELIDAQRLTSDACGSVLVWTDDTPSERDLQSSLLGKDSP